MICSTVIGTVGPVKELYKTLKDEKFFIRDICIDRHLYPLIISEYLFPENKTEGKYSVCVYVHTEKVEEENRSYLYACNAEETPDSSVDCDTVKISGYCKRLSFLHVVSSTGELVFTFKLQYKSYSGHKNYAKCIVKNQYARKFKGLLKNADLVEITGNLKECLSDFEVEVNDIKILKRGDRV